jgi:signal transduction histidine kinase
VRTKLTLWFVFGVVLIAALGATALNLVLSNQLHDQLDSDLTQQLTRYIQTVASATDESTLIESTREFLSGPQSSPLRRNGYILSLQTSDGTVVSNSSEIRLEELAQSQESLRTGSRFLVDVSFVDQPYRVLGTPVLQDGIQIGAVQLAGSLADIATTLRSVLLLSILGGLLGVILVGSGSWLLLGRALGPVRRITATAAAISREDLSRRIGYTGPRDEIGNLAKTMDGMLDRLQASFESQEQFISDVSHELRTPLTIVKGHLQVLDRQENPSPDTIRKEHALVLDELDRMNRLVGDLLTLARATRVDFLRKENIDADLFLKSLVGQGEHLGDRAWRIDRLPGRALTADQDRLTQVFLNLMQNAVAHTQPGDVIALGGEMTTEGAIRLWVRDEGAGMDEETRSRVFERFYRGAAGHQRTEGLGLGLALAKAIVDAHEGRIEVESSPGRGTRFVITLP